MQAAKRVQSGTVKDSDIQCTLHKVLDTSKAHQRWLATDLLQHLLYNCPSLRWNLSTDLPRMLKRVIDDPPASTDSAATDQAKAELNVYKTLDDLMSEQILRIVQLPVHWQVTDTRGQQVPCWHLQTLCRVCKEASGKSNVYKDDMKKAKVRCISAQTNHMSS